MSYGIREQLTWAALLVLSGMAACSAAQRQTVHDVLDGVHSVCESTDPLMHMTLERLEPDGGTFDGDSATRD